MKILFLKPGFEHLGVLHLASYVEQQGHTPQLVVDPVLFADSVFNSARLSHLMDYGEPVMRKIAELKPDAVGIPVLSAGFAWANTRARQIKDRLGVPVIFGGPHCTAVPEETMRTGEADYAFVADAEIGMARLLDVLEKGGDLGSVPNLIWRNGDAVVTNELAPLIRDLDTLPFPAKDLYYDANPGHGTAYNIISARYCPLRCKFCYNATMEKIYGAKKWGSRRSPANVVAELREGKTKRRFNYVRFFDDLFTADEAWLSEFAPMYARDVNVPYHCSLHPSFVGPKVVEALKLSGCREVQMGVETVAPDTKKTIRRGESLDQIRDGLARLKAAGIRNSVDIIIGLPGQEVDDLRQ
ncbi:B12-binding domain-containing radical SAM protein, partial [bacterium]|nr:B12-binding domain-containing radical SAM protein [bacterium]